MSKARLLMAPIFSLFDFKIYREIRVLRASTAVLYLTYLSALFVLFFLLNGIVYAPRADAFIGWLQKNMVGMTLSREGMKLDQPGRVELRHPEWGPLAVFDDTVEQINPEQMGDYSVYVTSKMVYFKRNGAVRTNPIGARAQKDFKTRVDGNGIRKVYEKLKVPVFGLTLFLVFVIGWIGRAIFTLVLTLVGYVVQLFIPRGLGFESLFVQASFASSIGLVFSVLQMVPQLMPFFIGPVANVLSLVYLIIAIAVQPKPAAPQV